MSTSRRSAMAPGSMRPRSSRARPTAAPSAAAGYVGEWGRGRTAVAHESCLLGRDEGVVGWQHARAHKAAQAKVFGRRSAVPLLYHFAFAQGLIEMDHDRAGELFGGSVHGS